MTWGSVLEQSGDRPWLVGVWPKQGVEGGSVVDVVGAGEVVDVVEAGEVVDVVVAGEVVEVVVAGEVVEVVGADDAASIVKLAVICPAVGSSTTELRRLLEPSTRGDRPAARTIPRAAHSQDMRVAIVRPTKVVSLRSGD
jgi:hypothetical protein